MVLLHMLLVWPHDVVQLVVWTSCVFFFKQKTAYEMRISDWSSDVCSSDLPALGRRLVGIGVDDRGDVLVDHLAEGQHMAALVDDEIGRASCRERVCQYV